MNLKKYSAFILMLFCTTFLMAQTEKRFSLSFSNIPLSEAMPKVEKASGYKGGKTKRVNMWSV